MAIEARRSLLKTLASAAGMLLGSSLLIEAQAPQPMASPNAPRNQNAPAGMDGPDIIHPDKAPGNPLLQQQIASYVQQLYKLATELKEESERTNMNSTFSLTFVKKAQQIEKLAKQIKEKSKG